MFAKIKSKVQLSIGPALLYPRNSGFGCCCLSQGFSSSAIEPSGAVLA